MQIPSLWGSILGLIAVWAVIGVLRDVRGTRDAARFGYAKLRDTLERDGTAQPGQPVRPGDVAIEFAVGVASLAAGFGTAVGWAIGQDAARSYLSRRAARRPPPGPAQPEPGPAVGPAPAAGSGPSARGGPKASGGSGRPGGSPPAGSTGPAAPGAPDQQQPADQGQPATGFWRLGSLRRFGRPTQTAPGTEPAASDKAEVPDSEYLEVIDDPSDPAHRAAPPSNPAPASEPAPATAAISDENSAAPAGTALKETPIVPDLANAAAGSLSPSMSLNQAKSDLERDRDAGVALYHEAGVETTVAGARATQADNDSQRAADLAEGARKTAANRAASLAFFLANRGDRDHSSADRLAATVTAADRLVTQLDAAAAAAADAAAAEKRKAAAFAAVGTSAADFSAVTSEAKQTLSAHQDPHQAAAAVTGHEGATAAYLLG